MAPFIEVLFGDWLAGEVAGQDGLDVGGGIEPIEEGGTVLVVGEAAVEFIAQGAREAGDFTIASHGFSGWWIEGLAATGDRRSGTSVRDTRSVSAALYTLF